jgi:uncharacterized protein YndB with AHSA1/START domain
MYTFTVSVEIAAPPARVWRALCRPAEVVQWDSGVVEAVDAPPDYPRPGQHVRWRYASGPFRVLHDQPQEVVAERTLHSFLGLGPFRFDETYTLDPLTAGCRLTAAMRVRASFGVLGWMLERLYLGPRTRVAVTASLLALKQHCETHGPDEEPRESVDGSRYRAPARPSDVP